MSFRNCVLLLLPDSGNGQRPLALGYSISETALVASSLIEIAGICLPTKLVFHSGALSEDTAGP